MQPDDNEDKRYTYNELNNEDKQLLLSHGYKPGEMEPEDERQILEELHDEYDTNEGDSENEGTIADEKDGTDSI